MKQRKHETNVEFLTRVMEFSRSGALMQGFILQAIEQYANAVKNAPIVEPKEEEGFINFAPHPVVWRDCAIELLQEIEQHYK